MKQIGIKCSVVGWSAWHSGHCIPQTVCNIKCSGVQCIVVKCIVVQFNAVKFSAAQYSAVQCSTAQLSSVQCSVIQCSAVQCSAVQYSAGQCSAVQCSAVSLLRCCPRLVSCGSAQITACGHHTALHTDTILYTILHYTALYSVHNTVLYYVLYT